MEKGFPGMRHAAQVMLLMALMGASGTLSAAEVRGIRVAATETGTRVVLDLSAPVTHKAFKLDDPARVVVDVAQASMKSKVPMPEATGAVTGVRSGKLPRNGLRLVFEVNGPVSIESSLVAPSGDAGHRLVIDLETPGAVKQVSVTPA